MRDLRHRWIWAISFATPVVAMFVLPPSFALSLQIPAAIAVRAIGIRSTAVGVLFTLAIYCASIALPVALAIMVMFRKEWLPKICLVVLAVIGCALLVVKGRSENGRVYEGILETGFEYSAFYPDGQCWRPPYWLVSTPDLHWRTNSLAAAQVKFVGDATAIGGHGHLGQYMREVRVRQVLDVQPAQACRP